MYAYCNGNPVMFVDPTGMYAFGDGWNWLKKNVFAPVRQFVDDAFNYLNNLPDWVGEVAVLVGVAAFAFVFGPLIMATNAMDTAGPEATREFFGTLGNIGAFVIGGFGDAFAGFVDLIGKLNFELPTLNLSEIFAGGGIIGRVIDFFRNRQSNGQPYSLDGQTKADWYMRNACLSLLDYPDKYPSFTEGTWYSNSTTDNNRKDILEALFNEVYKHLNLERKPNFIVVSFGDDTKGEFIKSSNTIRINADFLVKPNSHELRQIVIHESRHAYQWEAVQGKNHIVTDDIIRRWRDNFDYYIEHNGVDNYREYISQPIEYDAHSFAGQASALVYATDPNYPNSWNQ